MAIIFKEEKKQFYLHTDHTSYIIELLEGRIPLHAYWGKRLEDMPPLTTWSSSVTTCFNGMDVETSAGAEFGCTGTLPLEKLQGVEVLEERHFAAKYRGNDRITSKTNAVKWYAVLTYSEDKRLVFWTLGGKELQVLRDLQKQARNSVQDFTL